MLRRRIARYPMRARSGNRGICLARQIQARIGCPGHHFPRPARMNSAVTTFLHICTADDLATMPDDGRRYELVNGELQMMSPAGGGHGRIAARLNALLWNHVNAQNLGDVYAAETGFLLSRNPDTVRAPDAAFVSRERAAGLDDTTGYPPIAPDLVAEVISPSDRFSEVEIKTQAWLEAGTRI